MDGHMACHHSREFGLPPDHYDFSPIHYALDAVWAGMWVLAGVLAFVWEHPRLRRLAPVLLFVIFFRFVLGSLGGILPGI
jgi:hypothetical protein